MYRVGQVAHILPHRVLVRGSVGVAYWSGVRPCTSQGLRRRPRTGQGSDRVLVRGSVEGHVLVRGRITRVCIYIYICYLCIYIYTPSTGQGLRRVHVLVRGQIVYWSVAPEGVTYWSGVGVVKGSRGVVYWSGVVFMLYTHTHKHTHTHGFFLSQRMHPLADAGVCLASIVIRFGLVNVPTSLDFLDDCLFSPKCQRISINFSQNRIFGVGMRESFDAITAEGSQRHHGRRRCEKGVTPWKPGHRVWSLFCSWTA